ncbi:MAG: universal stress protein UspA [Pseudomonadales bacterium]|jgi:nucleotide-binding universal stress UspA family protein|nr:universal stress protein UspA [Pseudomonadales bacterium]MEC8810024.1 universal stress protein [Pseudomonadota bacterium]HAG93216.1 universal stress protein UspA [Gammaproteobacteria bacterium]MBI28201.1 universal stress protein UspA [Pseudomonadales bacterium]HAU13682.1 universal stress protein UspA [Gammaproteobacteria bacterium]|tara:strand:- start:3257 stop:3781 length:525 start_codon:yes stop_codon:yes gene_type:complete
MLNNILYATDLGLYGPYILEHVCELANKHSAQVTVIHAVEPVSVFAGALLETYVPQEDKAALRLHGYEAVMTTIRARVRQAFEEDFIDRSEAKTCIQDVLVLDGEACEVILETARAVDADLIVMGTHGNQSDNSTAIGSVASKVLQLSHIPIYLVPTTAVGIRPNQQQLRKTRI